MQREQFMALADFYIDPDSETTDSADGYIKTHGIELEMGMEQAKALIKKKKAELKLEGGRRLRSLITELKAKAEENRESYGSREELLFAFRDLEGITDEDMSEIESDSLLLEEIDKLIDDKGI